MYTNHYKILDNNHMSEEMTMKSRGNQNQNENGNGKGKIK